MYHITRSFRLSNGLRATTHFLRLHCKVASATQVHGFHSTVSLRQDLEDETPVDPATINWQTLGFDYMPTNGAILYQWNASDGWNDGQITSPFLRLHMMSNVLHYGQAVFEGLKAFHTQQGTVQLFNPKENYNRLSRGLERLGMPELPQDVFLEALHRVVKHNVDYVPPFGSGGSLYIRPFVCGHGAKLGLGKATKYSLGIIVSPVGSYYKSGLEAVDSCVVNGYDRAAPLGVGNVKTAGNYAADVKPATELATKGYPLALYLDALEHKYIEEFSTSNFIAISGDGKKYLTPKSDSILKSITNIMLRQLAKDRGLEVEERPIEFEEVRTFSQVAACGTAVIVTPVKSITRGDEKITIGENYEILAQLYQDVRALQTGEKEDVYGWCEYVCDKPHTN